MKRMNVVCKYDAKTDHALFLKALDHIGPLLKNGSTLPCQILQSIWFNQMAHMLLFTIEMSKTPCRPLYHHDDTIQFAMNPRINEAELVFSSDITAADLATR